MALRRGRLLIDGVACLHATMQGKYFAPFCAEREREREIESERVCVASVMPILTVYLLSG